MKRLLSIILLLCIALCGCTSNGDSGSPANNTPSTSTPETPAGTDSGIVMFDADPLPAELTIKNLMVNAEYDVILKAVSFRELSALEKEKAYTKNLGFIAIIQYSAQAKDPAYSNELTLGDEFAIVLGNSSFNHKINSILLDESEYTTDDYAEGYYQGYIILEVSQEAANNDSTQLRYVEKGGNIAAYYNIHE